MESADMNQSRCVIEKKTGKCAVCQYWQKINNSTTGICWRNSFPCDTALNDICALFRKK